MSRFDQRFEMAFNEQDVPYLGFFSWNVADNCLTGDANFAGLYGFTLEQVVSGVTVQDVMARIVPGDRERMAFEVHSGILSGESGSTTYTVFDGVRLRTIVAIGRCLHDADGVPSYYTGTIFEQPDRTEQISGSIVGGNVVRFQPLHRASKSTQ